MHLNIFEMSIHLIKKIADLATFYQDKDSDPGKKPESGSCWAAKCPDPQSCNQPSAKCDEARS